MMRLQDTLTTIVIIVLIPLHQVSARLFSLHPQRDSVSEALVLSPF